MDIKVLGMGCPSCRRLEANVAEALAGLNVDARVEKVTDLKAILGYGVSTTPALVVDGRVVLAGQVPAAEQIRAMLIPVPV
ncbi:MAG TPA: thioredoxin family protein [Thermoanaerobaculia bacterium]|nr:thioredoxin family protein [Thermoanaerobaculia bacterium]